MRTELKNDCACVTFDPVGQSSFEIAQSARHLARKYRFEQHIPNETLDFAVKFRLVFRYETVVSRRYVLALLPVGLLRKFEAYLVYLTLIWGKFPRRYSCFQTFHHFRYMFPGFPARISDMRNRFSALSNMGGKCIQVTGHMAGHNVWFSYVGKIPDGLGFYCFPTVPDFAD